jgi:hypothetical protein
LSETTGKHDELARGISALYTELRYEIELLGKARGADPNGPAVFPDPVCLNDIERRLLVRSIFAFVEALTYSIKTLTLTSLDIWKLSTAERSLAADECYDLSTSGSVTTRRAKLHTLANIRFAFDILAKVEGNEFQLDVSQGGWQLLQRSMKIRDRLMHPKAASDLRVSDEEIRDSVRAFMWFEKQLVRLLLVTINAVRGQHSRLMEELAQGLEDSSLPPPMAH